MFAPGVKQRLRLQFDVPPAMKFLAAIALPAYLLDQITKWAILFTSERDTHWTLEIVPGFFSLVYWQNTGAAFSIGHGKNAFFIALSLVTLAGLLFAWKKNVFADSPSRWGVALLVGGILGNVTDRIVHKHVVDFLLVDLHVRFANPWPAFNVADSCICIAAGLFVIAGIRDAGKPRDSAGVR
jgi:signal peptidase II